MQVTTNESFAHRRGLIGRLGTIAGFVVLVGGMYVSLQQPQNPGQIWLPWLTLVLGIILLNIGKYNSMRWGTNPRVDRAIALALKTFDHRYHLYNFVPTLPADHVLVTPHAVVVLEARPFFGNIIHDHSHWKRPLNLGGLLQLFTDGGIGNPTKEAQKDAEGVQRFLNEHLGEAVASTIPVLPMIVCTNPRLKLTVNDPDVPVVQLPDLRGALRQGKDPRRIPSDVQREIVQAFQWEPGSKKKASSTTRSSTWQRTQK